MRRPLAAIQFLAVLLALPTESAWAQGRVSAFGIADNSFLVEEAYNQEAGIFQNIFVMTRLRPGQWFGAFTQEWPLFSQRHQISYTLPVQRSFGDSDIGDMLVNYRLQLGNGEDGRPAFAPRVSAVLPMSEDSQAVAGLVPGWQFNLPVSYERGRFVLHANAGVTWFKEAAEDGMEQWTSTPFVAGSIIWAARPMFHPMFEVYSEWSAEAQTGERAATVTFVPGIRAGWNLGDHQLVGGLGLTITTGGQTRMGGLVYVSYELPFKK